MLHAFFFIFINKMEKKLNSEYRYLQIYIDFLNMVYVYTIRHTSNVLSVLERFGTSVLKRLRMSQNVHKCFETSQTSLCPKT